MKGFKVIVLVATILAAAPLFAAVDAFLKIDGIPGESTEPAHKDWIEIYSFRWGVSSLQTAAAHGSGGGAGHELQQATFIAGGKAVPKMFLLCQNGKLLPAVVVDLHGQRETLERVMFASCQNNMMGDGSVRGTFTVKFERTTHAGGAQVATAAGGVQAAGNAAGGVQAGAMLSPNRPAAGNAQLLIGLLRPQSLSLSSLKLQGNNSAIIAVREAANQGFFSQAYASRTKTPKVTLKTQSMTFTFTEVLVSSYSRGADGTDTFTINFTKFDGPPAGFQQ